MRVVSFPPVTCEIKALASRKDARPHKPVILHGYLGNQRNASKNLTFAELTSTDLAYSVQVLATSNNHDGAINVLDKLRSLSLHDPVVVHGTVKGRGAKPTSTRQVPGAIIQNTEVEIHLTDITPLNSFPKDIVMHDDTVMPSDQRHLQLRQDNSLRDGLTLRSRACSIVRTELCMMRGFTEIETPLLFKSTPEGAREFLVPTRTPGLAYALPQSPQQYKQILMASGIPRYLQFAKCFRDEDLRADRQPEFTQVDLEMSFATGEDVMNVVESLVRKLWQRIINVDLTPDPFPCMAYQEAMSVYGSDKPDTRLDSKIQRVDYMLPVDLISKIGPLSSPIVEVLKIPISSNPATTRDFVGKFMDSPAALPFIHNPSGQPGIFIYDSRKPLAGLQVFGFEAAEVLEDTLSLSDGDLIVLQARPNAPFSGGSTPLGNLRLALHRFGVQHSYLPPPSGFSFLWVTDFPLFTPSATGASAVQEPGQGGSAGLSSTHHPFTSPKTAADVDKLLTSPLEVIADHYDLVVNGIELGGGSRRIHSSAMQTLILRDILKLPPERLSEFDHLIEVLRAGCPPHAGMALGFDRLMAVMLGRESVRDVIAFPKTGKGEDGLVGAPARISEEQLRTYHLRLREEKEKETE